MKRLNPETGEPFKSGDVRHDGYVFFNYDNKMDKNGYNYERWLSPSSYEKQVSSVAKYAKENKEQAKVRSKDWYNQNKGRAFAKVKLYQMNKIKRTPSWVTQKDKQQMKEIYDECLKRTQETGIQHHVDHVIPLHGKFVCGLHVPSNLQIMTREKNLEKSNKYEIC